LAVGELGRGRDSELGPARRRDLLDEEAPRRLLEGARGRALRARDGRRGEAPDPGHEPRRGGERLTCEQEREHAGGEGGTAVKETHWYSLSGSSSGSSPGLRTFRGRILCTRKSGRQWVESCYAAGCGDTGEPGATGTGGSTGTGSSTSSTNVGTGGASGIATTSTTTRAQLNVCFMN